MKAAHLFYIASGEAAPIELHQTTNNKLYTIVQVSVRFPSVQTGIKCFRQKTVYRNGSSVFLFGLDDRTDTTGETTKKSWRTPAPKLLVESLLLLQARPLVSFPLLFLSAFFLFFSVSFLLGSRPARLVSPSSLSFVPCRYNTRVLASLRLLSSFYFVFNFPFPHTHTHTHYNGWNKTVGTRGIGYV